MTRSMRSESSDERRGSDPSKPRGKSPTRRPPIWWPLFGLGRQLTERRHGYARAGSLKAIDSLFRRSLFVYPIDVGNSNALNIELAALRTPQYNVHRFGIFFTDTPRHADLLLVLGRPTPKSSLPLAETIDQLPHPFGILHLYEPFPPATHLDEVELPNLVGTVEGTPSAEEILGFLLATKGGPGGRWSASADSSPREAPESNAERKGERK